MVTSLPCQSISMLLNDFSLFVLLLPEFIVRESDQSLHINAYKIHSISVVIVSLKNMWSIRESRLCRLHWLKKDYPNYKVQANFLFTRIGLHIRQQNYGICLTTVQKNLKKFQKGKNWATKDFTTAEEW